MTHYPRRIISNILSRMHNHVDLYIDLALIIGILSFPFLRIGLNGIVDQSDTYFPLYPVDFFTRMLFAWDEFGAYFGTFQFHHVSHLPFYALPAFLAFMGLSINVVNRLTMITYLAALGLSGYFMMRTFYKNSYRFTPIIAAIFCAANPYISGELWLGHWTSILSFAGLPLLLIAFAKGLEVNRKWIKWAIVVGLVSMIIAPRLRLIPVVTVTIGTYLVLHLFAERSRKQIVHSIKFVSAATLFSVVTNFGWILPISTNFQSMFISTYEIYLTISPNFPPTFSRINNILGLVGYGIPNGLWGSYFASEVAIFSALLIVFLSYTAVFMKPKDKAVRFFTCVSFLFTLHMALFVNSSSYQTQYIWLARNLPQPFNFLLPKDLAYLSLPVAISYGFLLGVTLDELVRRVRASSYLLKARKKTFSKLFVPKFWISIFGVFAVSLVLLNSLPLFIGARNDPIAPIFIPSYYDDVRSWLGRQKGDFKLFAIPSSDFMTYNKYVWVEDEYKVVTDILPQVSPVPVIRTIPGSGFVQGREIVELAYSDSTGYENILAMLGVKYIVVRNDTREDAFQISTVQRAEESFVLEDAIGQLWFYRTEAYAPTLYASSSVIPVWGDLSVLSSLSQLNSRSFSSSVFYFLPEETFEDAAFVTNVSRKILVSADFPGDDTLTSVVSQVNPQVMYMFKPSSPSYISSLHNGTYDVVTVNPEGIASRGNTIEVGEKEILFSPNFEYITSSSIELQGTSIESDQIQVFNESLPVGMKIQWIADSRIPGFHALFLRVNATQLKFDDLLSSGGGFSLRIFGDGSGRELRFSFMNPEERRFQWPLRSLYMNWTGWKELTLPFREFEAVDSPQWNNVVSIWIWQDIHNAIDYVPLQISTFAKLLSSNTSFLVPPEYCQEGADPVMDSPQIDNETQMQYMKVDPTKYIVYVELRSPSFLILNNGYDPGWKAHINGLELRHFRMNSFSNGFYIPNAGKYTVEISFAPQRYYETGLRISFFSFILAVMLIIGVHKPLYSKIALIVKKKQTTKKTQ